MINNNRYLNDINLLRINWKIPGSDWADFKIPVKEIGEYIAEFIDIMVAKNLINSLTLEIVAHGYGCHITGQCITE